MTISVPVAQVLITTNITDSTALFDPSEHLASYPSGMQYKHNNNIYQNTGDTVEIKDYILADEGSYTNGQVIWKDGVNTNHQYLSGSFPKQPDNYTEVQNTGFDTPNWTTRYSKLIGIPAGFVNNNSADLGMTLPNETVLMSPDGTKMIEVEYSYSYSFDLSEVYNPSSGTQTSSYTNPFGVYSADNASINDAGTKMLMLRGSSNASYINEIKSLSLSTAWNISTATVTGTKTMENYGSWAVGMRLQDATFNDTGTVVFAIYQDTTQDYRTLIQKFTLSTAWDIDTITYNSEQWFDQLYALGTNGLHVYMYNFRFENSGTEIIVTGGRTGGQHAFRFSLATAWDIMSTKTLLDVAFSGFRLSNVFFNTDRTKCYFQNTDLWNYGTSMYYTPDAGNLGLTLQSTDRFEATEVDNANSIVRRWIFMVDVNSPSGYRSYVQIYDLNSGNLLLENMSDTNNTFYYNIDNDSVQNEAVYPITDGSGNSIAQLKTLIWASDGVYTRTNQARYAEFESLSYHAYLPITKPLDITGFALIEATNDYKPFDNKNYSYAETQNTMTYTIKGLSKFDTLALGNVLATNALIKFILPDTSPSYDLWLDGSSVESGGNGIVTVVNKAIDTSHDTSGNLNPSPTTEVYYSEIVMDIDSTVEITLTGDNVELGTIMLGMSVGAGFSNLSISHTYKDFSVADYDQWGNLDYIERQRILSYNGSVDIHVTDYDRVIRLFTYLGKKLVIVNGSTSKTNSPDSQNIFASTQKIGRFMSFNQKTKVTNGDMDMDASYSFVLEELA